MLLLISDARHSCHCRQHDDAALTAAERAIRHDVDGCYMFRFSQRVSLLLRHVRCRVAMLRHALPLLMPIY